MAFLVKRIKRHLREESENADNQHGNQNKSQGIRFLENEGEERRKCEERDAAREEKDGGNVDHVRSERHLVEYRPNDHEPRLEDKRDSREQLHVHVPICIS